MLRLDILDVCIAFEKLLLRDIVNDAKHRILGNQQTYNYMKLIFILQYNFKALVDETMAVTQAVPTHVVDQFLKRFPIYEKGKGDLSQLE